MIPYNAYAYVAATVVLAIIPIATTYPDVSLPPWVGLILACLSAGLGVLLKQMAPATDVHKDSELPQAFPVNPVAREARDLAERIAALGPDEQARLRAMVETVEAGRG